MKITRKIILFIPFLLSFVKPVSAQASSSIYFFPNFEDNDGISTKYYSLPGGTTAVRQGNTLSYLHTDQISSTRLITNNQGTVNSRLDYFPYGQTVNSQSVIRNSLIDRLYTSQILDDSANLYYYNARQYNPATGAFISADSAVGPNRYAYVSGNPINLNDPTGHEAFEDPNPVNFTSEHLRPQRENPTIISDKTFDYFKKGSGRLLNMNTTYQDFIRLKTGIPSLNSNEAFDFNRYIETWNFIEGASRAAAPIQVVGGQESSLLSDLSPRAIADIKARLWGFLTGKPVGGADLHTYEPLDNIRAAVVSSKSAKWGGGLGEFVRAIREIGFGGHPVLTKSGEILENFDDATKVQRAAISAKTILTDPNLAAVGQTWVNNIEAGNVPYLDAIRGRIGWMAGETYKRLIGW